MNCPWAEQTTFLTKSELNKMLLFAEQLLSKLKAEECVFAKSTLICQGWKAEQKNMFFKSLPCNLVFPIYLPFSLSPLGLRQLWLKTNSEKSNLSIWNGLLNHASSWDCWRRRGKQRPPLLSLSDQRSQRWCHENCHIQMKSACAVSGTKWEHPKTVWVYTHTSAHDCRIFYWSVK